MDKKIIEYLIIATVVILLLYGFVTFEDYNFPMKKANITDSITMYYPTSSEYSVKGDRVEFRNVLYDIYNMDVSKLNSSSKRVTNLLNHHANFNQGTVDYLNDSCYMITSEFDDGSGFNHHCMIIPIDCLNKENLTFKKNATVYLFDGNNRKFVVDAAFESQVIM